MYPSWMTGAGGVFTVLDLFCADNTCSSSKEENGSAAGGLSVCEGGAVWEGGSGGGLVIFVGQGLAGLLLLVTTSLFESVTSVPSLTSLISICDTAS